MMIETFVDYFSPPISLKKWVVWASILFFTCLSVFTWLYAQNVIRSLCCKRWYLKAIDEQIFVSPQTDSLQIEKILVLYNHAQQRIDSLFGDVKSKPSVIIATDERLMSLFGDATTTTGMTHLTPFGSVVVIGKEGLNVDVLSHELCHAELMERVGWYVRRKKIPIWFDEGLAMQVDSRFDYWYQLNDDWGYFQQKETLADLIRIEDKKTAEEFFTEDAKLHYFLAQQKLRKWYHTRRQEGLSAFIEHIKEKDFEKAFELE